MGARPRRRAGDDQKEIPVPHFREAGDAWVLRWDESRKCGNRPPRRDGLAAEFALKIIVERGVNGREIEVSVLGNDDIRASIPGEIVPHREYYDYAAKY